MILIAASDGVPSDAMYLEAHDHVSDVIFQKNALGGLNKTNHFVIEMRRPVTRTLSRSLSVLFNG